MKAQAANISGGYLLRQYKDKKPDLLAREVKNAMNAGGVVWREPASSDDEGATKERWSNLDFLRKGKARSVWKDYWPPNRCRFSWDAIGRIRIGKGLEWLLVTAFAHSGELEHNPEPPLDGADERIVSAIDEAKRRYGIEPGIDWINTNSHLATRLSALSFLRKHGVCSRMLFVYFHAEETKEDDLFPSLETWDTVVTTTEQRLGLTGESVLERRISQMFLPAKCD